MTPEHSMRRSFVARRLEGAELREIAGGAVAMRFGEDDERALAARLGLADLSILPRIGFKGRAALAWLRRQGVALEDQPNHAFAQEAGELAVVLGPGEALILSGLDGAAPVVERLERAWSIDAAPGCFAVPRRDSHAWFLITGTQAAAMLAKLCAIDLRPLKFANHRIAQTLVAGSAAIVIRADLGATPAFHLLADSALAESFWDCLLDAMAELDGRPVGLAALHALAAR